MLGLQRIDRRRRFVLRELRGGVAEYRCVDHHRRTNCDARIRLHGLRGIDELRRIRTIVAMSVLRLGIALGTTDQKVDRATARAAIFSGQRCCHCQHAKVVGPGILASQRSLSNGRRDKDCRRLCPLLGLHGQDVYVLDRRQQPDPLRSAR